MVEAFFHNPNLTIALALVAGIVAQSLATHLRVPGIVLLLLFGVILGPDMLGVEHPEDLGEGLSAIVGFAVAVILFEGGMNLHLPRIQRAGAPIRRLITVGAVVTAIGATITVRAVMQWPWPLAVLFGTLVTVTGPTVVNPLLKRLRVEKQVSTILEAEGVLIDPIGAILAFVALEVVIHPTADNILLGIPELALTLGLGTGLGVVGGYVMSRMLKVRGLVPEGMTNVFTLSMVFALYQLSEGVMHESGIAAVTMAGIAVRYLGTPVERELLEFKEQLTVMLIGMLFILLAADVRLADVQALGWPGLITVLVLMAVVRPLTVLVSTMGTGLSWQQQAFVAYIAPRGIVAAAVASLFAVKLDEAGIEGGTELRALVFLVITVTVVSAGLTGGLVARLLGLRRPANVGWVILGAHSLARKMAHALIAGGEEALLIDVNPENCRHAEEEGIRVLHGNAMKDTTLGRAELGTRIGAMGLTRNEEVNFLFVQKARHEARLQHLYVSLSDDATGVTAEMVHKAHAQILFGGAHDIERWSGRLDHGTARTVQARFVGIKDEDPPTATDTRCGELVLPLVYMRQGVLRPVHDGVTFKRNDQVVLVIDTNFEQDALDRLRARGFQPAEAASETAGAPVTDEEA